MTIKQTLANNIRVLWLAIITTILYLLGLSVFGFERGAIYVFLAGYILTVVPSFYLHIQYHLKNKGLVCQILPGRLCLSKNGQDQVIETSDIKDIVIYKAASIEKGGIPITPMEAYFFVRVLDNAGKTYDLTCLMDPKIDKSIRLVGTVPIFTERGLFNSL